MEKQADHENVNKFDWNELIKLIEKRRKEDFERFIFFTSLSYEEFQKQLEENTNNINKPI